LTDDTLRQPRTETLEAEVAAAAANADASGGYVTAPFDGTVSAAEIIASAAITGADTESRTIQLHNRGQAGSGTTLVASKAFVEEVDAAADDATALTLSGTAANLEVEAGDILEFTSLHIGTTGLAGPKFTGRVTFEQGAG
jgi:hypothetical protein